MKFCGDPSSFKNDPFSAITLAGAAAEIFKNIKEKVHGEKSIEDEAWEAIEEARMRGRNYTRGSPDLNQSHRR